MVITSPIAELVVTSRDRAAVAVVGLAGTVDVISLVVPCLVAGIGDRLCEATDGSGGDEAVGFADVIGRLVLADSDETMLLAAPVVEATVGLVAVVVGVIEVSVVVTGGCFGAVVVASFGTEVVAASVVC